MATQPELPESLHRSSSAQSWVLVGTLTFAYAVSFLDRTIIVLLLEPIKQTFGVSDTALGLLHGFGFIMFYLLLGVPIGRLVDRYSRKLILITGIVVWSLMTAACGIAPTFFWLLMARLGVGAGEATLGPAAFSMIGDAVNPDEQPRALAIYSMGISIGSGMALIVGGWVLGLLTKYSLPAWTGMAHLEPWQVVCILAAMPGVLVVVLLILLREPERRSSQTADETDSNPSVPIRDILRYVGENRVAYASVIGAFSLVILAGYGVGTWIPTFLYRTYGISMSQIGVTYGVIATVTGLLGASAAAALSGRLAEAGRRDAAIILMLVGVAGGAVALPLYTLAPTAFYSFAGLALNGFFGGFPFGAAAAAINQITPGRMRGQMSAVFHLAINLIGVGFGPILVGFLTDQVFTTGEGIRYSILATGLTILPLSAMLFWLSRGSFMAARESAERFDAGRGRPDEA